MADLSPTVANVLAGTGATIIEVVAGATVVQGDVVYRDTAASNKAKLADSNAAASAVVAGMCLNAASDGQPLRICTKGNYNPGAAVAVGVQYVLSEEPGKIALDSDIGSAVYKSAIGIASTTSNIVVNIQNSGKTLA